jgi:hypothetical protein
MLDLKSYAETFRVPLVRDECDELIIPGRFGHIYVHSDTQLGWCLMNTQTAHLKNAVIRRYVRTGRAMLHGEGDTEAIFLFDPNDAALFRDFLRRCGVPRKRPRTRRRVPGQGHRRKRLAPSGKLIG